MSVGENEKGGGLHLAQEFVDNGVLPQWCSLLDKYLQKHTNKQQNCDFFNRSE